MQAMTRHDGDLFGMMADFFDTSVEKLLKGPHREFYENVFLFMDFHNAAHFSSMPKKRRQTHTRKRCFLTIHLSTSTAASCA